MGNMGIKTSIAVGLLFVTASAHAVTNSWQIASSFWDISSSAWFAGFPSITNEVNLITNLTTKLVTVDNFTVSGSPSTLTISNLVVGAPLNVTNTLFLSNMQTNTPLHIINSFALTNNGVVQITNSFLEVDGLSGGISQIDGTLKIFPGAKVVLKNTTINADATLQFALGNNTSPIIVSNLILGGTLNVTDGGGFSNTTYTLFTYLGALTYNGLVVGSIPTNFNAVIDTSTLNQVNLIVGLAPPPPSLSSFRFISIAHNTNDVVLTWLATGGTTNSVQATSVTGDGSYNTNNFTTIFSPIFVPGSGSVTNSYTDLGGATNTPTRFYRIRLVP